MATSELISRYKIPEEPTACVKKQPWLASRTGHSDLISLLGRFQHCGIDYLPIKWQPALKDLGRGGSARVSQSIFNNETSFAYKRFLPDGLDSENCFEKLGKEVRILVHPSFFRHENFIRIAAFCYEIHQETERILPVLIYEKSPFGNLQDFLLSENARGITFSDRLGFCADIASVLVALHRYCWFD